MTPQEWALNHGMLGGDFQTQEEIDRALASYNPNAWYAAAAIAGAASETSQYDANKSRTTPEVLNQYRQWYPMLTNPNIQYDIEGNAIPPLMLGSERLYETNKEFIDSHGLKDVMFPPRNDDSLFGLDGLGEFALQAAGLYGATSGLGGLFGGTSGSATVAANVPGPNAGSIAQTFPVDMSGPQLLGGGGNMDWLNIGDEVARDIADFGIDGAASAWGVNAQDLAMFADDPSALGMLAGGAAQGATGGMMASSGWLSNIANTIKNDPMGAISQGLKAAGLVGADGKMNVAGMLGAGANTIGGILAAEQAKEAAQVQANAQIEAAKIAAEAARFKPVGVTTRFGSSQFGFDDKGNLTSAGYTLTPEMKAQQDALMATSGGLLSQFQGAQAATAPMGTAAQRAMQLGQGYLATDPAAQAAKYMVEQQALLAPTRERQMASTLQGEFNRGTYGLGTGSTSTGMMAANPRLEALMNAQRQQDLGLAAQATQGGMDYAKFGAGMVGTGGDLLKSMYGTQVAAFNPYQTALGGATNIEALGQNALQQGIDLGKTATTASANAGQALATGMTNAAATQAQGNAYSPWAGLLAGAGNYLTKASQPAPQGMMYNPYTGQPINWSQG
jgi:hypothetical protein